MSPSNDYAAVACSNNNQAQLHTHVSLPYMQQQQPGTVTHSRITSLLISRCLSRPRVASRYSVRTSSQLTS